MRVFRTGGAVLCFHSVTTRELPAEGLAHVPARQFAACIRAARRLGTLVPLSELLREHAAGRTAGLVAVTFDDAYASLSGDVLDFIVGERVPITIFVVAGAASTGAAYWWDRVDDLHARVTRRRWRAFEDACGLPDAYRAGQPPEHGPLRPLRQWLLAAYAGRWPPHLEPPLRALELEAGYQTPHRSLTFAGLQELATIARVEFGVHTMSHPVLPLLTDDEQREEIAQCYATLCERLPSVRPVLAPPFGLYDRRTVRTARLLGMKACLTLGDDVIGAGVGDMLPRLGLCRGESAFKLGLRLLGVPRVVRAIRGRRADLYPALPSPTT